MTENQMISLNLHIIIKSPKTIPLTHVPVNSLKAGSAAIVAEFFKQDTHGLLTDRLKQRNMKQWTSIMTTLKTVLAILVVRRYKYEEISGNFWFFSQSSSKALNCFNALGFPWGWKERQRFRGSWEIWQRNGTGIVWNISGNNVRNIFLRRCNST